METTVSSRLVYSGRVLNLRIDTVLTPDGATARREIVEHRGAVGIVPLDGDGNVVLVRQYRKAVERELLEIPAGSLEPGEESAVCARRELAEETGFSAGALAPLCAFYSSPGFCTELLEVFVATDLVAGQARPEGDESIEIVRLPLPRCYELVAAGEIKDAKTIIGLLALKSRKQL